MKKRSIRITKRQLIGVMFLIIIAVAVLGTILVRQNVAEHERIAILNILDYEYAVFANRSYKDKIMKEYALDGVDIGWDKEDYGQEARIFGDRIEFAPEVEENLISVAFLILLPERSVQNQWSKQEKVQVIIYKVSDPQMLSDEETVHALKYNEEYYFMAFEGDALKKEFHSILCRDFFADILDLATEYASWARYEFS